MANKPDLAELWRVLRKLRVQVDADDGNAGSVLRSLLETLDRELEKVQDELDAVYEDAFVETAEGWTVPYFGSLLPGVVVVSVAVGVYLCRHRAKRL